MITKQFYVSPTCETTVFLETAVLCTSTTLDPLTDNTETIVWLTPII